MALAVLALVVTSTLAAGTQAGALSGRSRTDQSKSHRTSASGHRTGAPAKQRAARARPRSDRHSGGYAPGCLGLRGVNTTPQAWLDNHSEQSTLVHRLSRLFCSAADHSTIDIKTWFFLIDDRVMQRFADQLRVMHVYHGVRVNIMLGREIYRRNHWSWNGMKRALPFANFISCYRECGTNKRGSVPHGKWVTVSKLRSGGPALVSLSTNWAGEQFRSAQSGIFVAGDIALYRAFAARWNQIRACAGSTSCAVPVENVWHQGDNETSVYFSPVPTDLTARALQTVDCSAGGTIQVLSMFFHRHPVEWQLARLQNQGCSVQIVLEHAPPDRFAGRFPLRCEHQHDKAIVVDVPGHQMVIAGSEALTTHALEVNENQMIRTTDAGVVAVYGRYLDRQWNRAHTCTRIASSALLG